MKIRMLIYRFLMVTDRILKIVLLFGLTLACFVVAMTVLHVGLGVCPFHFARFERSEVIPVVYGLPLPQTIQKARRGERVLGGCVVGPIAAVCPYCRWPARFSPFNKPEGVPLNDKNLKGLSPGECQEVKRYAKEIVNRAQVDMEERITAVQVTQTDIWLGTLYEGLHRYNRAIKVWKPYGGDVIGWCIKRIWQERNRIYVEHDTIGNRTFFYVDFSDDRGKTWFRL